MFIIASICMYNHCQWHVYCHSALFLRLLGLGKTQPGWNAIWQNLFLSSLLTPKKNKTKMSILTSYCLISNWKWFKIIGSKFVLSLLDGWIYSERENFHFPNWSICIRNQLKLGSVIVLKTKEIKYFHINTLILTYLHLDNLYNFF